MFGYGIDTAKSMFFDKPQVMRAVDAATRRALSKAGAFVRTAARSRIRKRKGVSAPGDPPSSHAGQLKDFILFVYEPEQKSVIIGPARLNQKVGNAPEALEKGGPSEGFEIGPHRKRVRRKFRVRARPYMAPALAQEAPKFPALWANSIRG